jgi:transposase InsO family protein
MTTTRPLQMTHMDLFGIVAYISIDGNKYGLVIVHDYSRFTWVFFLHDKSETQDALKKFLRRTQTEFDVKVKEIRSDNDIEFKNTQVEYFLDEEGIKHEFSAPYTPQQNGVAERKIVLLSRWQEPCLMNTRLRIGFGWRRSTRCVIQLTVSTSTSS